MYSAGRNIAIKLPADRYEETLAFYCDTLGFKLLEDEQGNAVLEFGPLHLHLQSDPELEKPDVWFEITAENMAQARRHLAANGVELVRDQDSLPPEVDGFWIASPAGHIHLVRKKNPLHG